MTDELAKTLRSLHELLAQKPKLDDASLEALQVLASDIDKVIERQTQRGEEDLEEGSGTDPEDSASSDSLSDRVQAFIDDVEAHHPQLTKTLSMIAERLSDMGI